MWTWCNKGLMNKCPLFLPPRSGNSPCHGWAWPLPWLRPAWPPARSWARRTAGGWGWSHLSSLLSCCWGGWLWLCCCCCCCCRRCPRRCCCCRCCYPPPSGDAAVAALALTLPICQTGKKDSLQLGNLLWENHRCQITLFGRHHSKTDYFTI